jgi:hypothetical protein
MALYAGQSAGLVRRLEPAADLVRALAAEASRLVEERLVGLLRAGSA